jgi:2-polyprenyl-3-methyl-5-hydroxy-6-metoxy-1,4-benzoquinol methylase
MTCCSHCADAETLFSRRAARRDLRKYRRRGPNASTRRMLDLIRREGVRSGLLLDIGGGVGAAQHELLREGMQQAIQVDASVPYLEASREEAARQGHGDRVEYHHGDFVDLAEDLPQADVVTLDRVVCCYPDMPRLVTASASRARHLYALTFPRARLPTRAFMAAGNLYLRLRRSAFRTYVHPPQDIRAEIEKQGLRRVSEARTLIWQVELYRRD